MKKNLCAACYWSQANSFSTRGTDGEMQYRTLLLCVNPAICPVPKPQARERCAGYMYEPGTDADFYKAGGTA